MGITSIIEFEPKEDNMKIKVLLKVLDKHNLIFQVLWMDERFRNYDRTFFAIDDIAIRSNNHPAIHSNLTVGVHTIFLQGVNAKKDDKACIIFVEDPYTEKKRIISALKDWALNWDGFKSADLEKETSVDNIYCI